MTKKVPKSSKRRLVVLGPWCIAIIIYFLFTIGIYGYKIINLANQEKQLKTKLVSLQANEQNLKVEIQKLKDPDYLARYAREHYLYSKNGEYIIKLEENEEKEANENNYDQYYEYIIYGAGGIVILMFIYIIKKSRKK